MWISVSLCILISAVPSHSKMDFTGDKVYSVTPRSESQVEYLIGLQDDAYNNALDMWVEPTTVSQPVTIRVPASHTQSFENKLNAQEIRFHMLMNNLQELVEAEEKENPGVGVEELSDDYALDTYHTYPSISAHLKQISDNYPQIATLENIGTTHMGYSILGLKLGTCGPKKPAIWIDAGIHAREWIAPATAIYIINQLVQGFEKGNKKIQNLLVTFDWYIFPVVNPDGYVYTWEENRFWRKNRVPTSNPNCPGVDVNRNFGVGFGGGGTSSENPCSHNYHGKCAFSEAETRAIRDGILKIGNRLQGYVSLHAFSQLILHSYGYTKKKISNYDDTVKLAKEMSKAIHLTHGKTYKFHPSFTLYPVSGESRDWATDVAKVKYAFIIEESPELKVDGTSGFILNKTEIIPTSEDIFAAIKVLAKTLKKEITQQANV